MAHLAWSERPSGDRPVMIAAFEGWNDAGDAATTAIEHLVREWSARPFAEVDPEEFYDFTSTRPQVRITAGTTRRIDWPANTFSWAEPPGTGGVVLLRGVEPQLRWRTFCTQVLEVAESTGCSMVVTLGALLADVAHTRPTSVFGNAYDVEVTERLGLEPSHYEGPTGIVGVLHAQCAAAGLDSASLWAAVPAYVPSVPSPKAALALVERASSLLDSEVDTDALRSPASAYEDQLTRLVEEDDATVDYVRLLEEQHDQDQAAVQSADDMVEEVERFLREQ
jgi:predicted ATP-grasp superfamily ATP-dependent carboligase